MHVLNLVAMGIGYASLGLMALIVIACLVFWVIGGNEIRRREREDAARRRPPVPALRLVGGAATRSERCAP